MGNAGPPKPENMTLEEERLYFFSALGEALEEWARVEAHLCCVFMVCLRAPHQRSAAAFYAVDSFRSKLQMVDAVVGLAVPDPAKIAEWKDLHRKIDRKSIARNELAHHEVLEDGKAKPGNRLTLRPAILNPHAPSVFENVGLHLNELRMRQTVFRQLADKVRHFYGDLCKLLGLPPK
jgi:hypothetical protein